MTQTNLLAPVTESDLAGSDLLRLWSQKFGGDTRMTLTVLRDWLDANLSTVGGLTTKYFSTAENVTLDLDDVNQWVIFAPAGVAHIATMNLPDGVDESEFLFSATQEINIKITPATGDSANFDGTTSIVIDEDTSLRLRFDGVLKTWFRIV